MQKKLIALCVLTLAIGMIYFIHLKNTSALIPVAEESIAHEGFILNNIEKFIITEYFGQYYSDERETNIAARNSDDFLRVKILSKVNETDAQKYASGQFLLLTTQYDPRLPPYPEFLTNKTGCKSEFLPVKHLVSNGTYYVVPAGARFNYGLCSDDLVEFRAGFGIFYCEPEQKIFQVEYFIPKNRSSETVKEFMDSFKCET